MLCVTEVRFRAPTKSSKNRLKDDSKDISSNCVTIYLKPKMYKFNIIFKKTFQTHLERFQRQA